MYFGCLGLVVCCCVLGEGCGEFLVDVWGYVGDCFGLFFIFVSELWFFWFVFVFVC